MHAGLEDLQDGETLARLRVLDWSQSLLGPQRLWSDALLRALGSCLRSRVAMHLWWGPHRVLLYNDASAALFASRHYAALLGMPARGCWARLWKHPLSVLEAVFDSGCATAAEDLCIANDADRPGSSATCLFAPLLSPSGRVEGVQCACIRSSGFAVGARAEQELHASEELAGLRALQELGTRLLQAEALPQVLEDILEGCIGSQSADAAVLQLTDAETKSLPIAAQRGLSPEHAARLPSLSAHADSTSARALQQRAWIVTDQQRLPAAERELAQAAGWRSVQVAPLIGRHGQTLGVCSLYFRRERQPSVRELHLTDLTLRLASLVLERKRDEQALREADLRKDEFLATLAHELRNPLTPISYAVQILRASPSEDSAVRTARDMIDRQVQHLVRLVDDLLEVTRIARGRIQLRQDRLDLKLTLVAAVEACRTLIEGAHHEIKVQLSEEPLWMVGDATRLLQVFVNLLHNAVKYTPAGGRIELCAGSAAGQAVVRINDSGVGIARGELERIFEMYVQVDSSLERARGGLGIGLTLAQNLARLHGGRIDAASEGRGRGSSFTVYLPLVPTLSTDRASHLQRQGPSEAGSQRLRVLIADDNVDAAESLALLLRQCGHDVSTAHDGGAALHLAAQLHPQVALLDIGMPQLNGYEACRRMRALPEGASILLVAVTGWGHEAVRRRAFEAGFDHHLTKPVEFEQLTALLRRFGEPAAREDPEDPGHE